MWDSFDLFWIWQTTYGRVLQRYWFRQLVDYFLCGVVETILYLTISVFSGDFLFQ